jgi:ABC-2 type transport system permease protein
MKNLFAGTPQLMRFILRKERVATAIWLGVLFALTLFVAAAYGAMEAEGLADLWANPAVIAMMGPIFGEANMASMYASSMILVLVITVAIMNIFFVIRNTRAEEEKSLGEVVRSLPIGRLANLAAVLSFAALMNLAVSILLCVALAPFYGFVGAVIFGLATGVSGVLFAAIAAVFANLSSSKGGAIGMSIGLVLLFYMLRAIGDVSAEVLSFISPFGLAARTQPFAGNIIWPLFVLLGLSIIFAILAFYLNSIRDFGRGILNSKAGRREGSYLMRSPEGLLFKLTRRTMIFWAIGLLALGASYGSVMGQAQSFLETIQTMMPSVTDVRMFIVMITMITALVSVIPSMAFILRIGGEEKNGRYEQIFAGSVSRHRMMSAHLTFALVQSFLMMFAAMFGLWAASYAVMSTPIPFGEMFGAFMVYLPAAWVMIGLSALVVSLTPKRASLIMYAYFGLSFAILYLGPMAGLPEAITYITPFGLIPQIPVDTVNPWTLVGLVAASIALIVGSYFLYRKRDLKLNY